MILQNFARLMLLMKMNSQKLYVDVIRITNVYLILFLVQYVHAGLFIILSEELQSV